VLFVSLLAINAQVKENSDPAFQQNREEQNGLFKTLTASARPLDVALLL
jgi:hypothetical protein